MHIRTAVVIGISEVMTDFAPEQLAALPLHALPSLKPRTSRLWPRSGYNVGWC
ncbi:MAG TPA: hypothetical protein VKB35_03780 [Ktedonobacteraceae bacterium]|nr:hypothetical protein [Ktedonobacteraceae bacterium]